MHNKGERYDSSNYQPEANNSTKRDRKIGAEASEVVKIDRAKAKKALYKIVATTFAIGLTTGFIVGGASNEAKHNQAPLSKEQYEAEVGDFLELREDYNIDFNDDGSVTVSYSDYWKGNPTEYELYDADGNAKFESGTAKIENNRASSTFNSEHGLSIEESYGQLNSGLAEKLSSTHAE